MSRAGQSSTLLFMLLLSACAKSHAPTFLIGASAGTGGSSGGSLDTAGRTSDGADAEVSSLNDGSSGFMETGQGDGISDEPMSTNLPRTAERVICDDFRSVWSANDGMRNDCGVCLDDARCAEPAQISSDCAGNDYCIFRNCVCTPDTLGIPGSFDCERVGLPDDMCRCVDSCLVPGQSPCRAAWYTYMKCQRDACANVCGI